MNANKVRSYQSTPTTTFSCKVEPVQDTAGTGLESAPVYEVFQVFTDYMSVESGDKIVIDGTTYVVKGRKLYKGLLRSYTIAYTQISNGT